MTNFKTILSDIGSGLKKFFSLAIPAAAAAAPIVDVAFPGISALYDTTVAAAAQAEAAALAAGASSGSSGAQKLALVVSAIEAQFKSYAAANGIANVTVTMIENWVNAVVASLNAIPASTAAPSPTPAA